MSLESDSRDCLIKAIADTYDVGISAEQLNTLKPSDPELGAKTDVAWRIVLSAAAACLRTKGHVVAEPTRKRAGDLLDKELVQSQLYLQELASPAKLKLAHFMMAGGIGAALGTLALAVRNFGSRTLR